MAPKRKERKKGGKEKNESIHIGGGNPLAFSEGKKRKKGREKKRRVLEMGRRRSAFSGQKKARAVLNEGGEKRKEEGEDHLAVPRRGSSTNQAHLHYQFSNMKRKRGGKRGRRLCAPYPSNAGGPEGRRERREKGEEGGHAVTLGS